MEGRVIKKNANIFTIDCGESVFDVMPSGKTKEKGIFVGDNVEFDDVITAVRERKNLLIRPPVANIDKMFIVVCEVPKADFLLVDKMIIYCYLNDIVPVIVINKIDIAKEDFIKQIEEDYKFLDIVKISAKNQDVKELLPEIDGICALAGQSAVGKSSIINAIFASEVTQTGHLSKKIERGKQTTRMVTLYKTENGYIADTAGFSMLDLSMISNLEKDELASYYPDFMRAREKCKYRSCLHEMGDCGIIEEVKSGKISQNRYKNYLKILNELKVNKKY